MAARWAVVTMSPEPIDRGVYRAHETFLAHETGVELKEVVGLESPTRKSHHPP